MAANLALSSPPVGAAVHPVLQRRCHITRGDLAAIMELEAGRRLKV